MLFNVKSSVINDLKVVKLSTKPLNFYNTDNFNHKSYSTYSKSKSVIARLVCSPVAIFLTDRV
ncbi:hypothetical protein [Moraxella lacunata]|uniref:hypothetical protein n=1 Tax=Moraxella lacunata TaxID=477 RepID=UPI003EE0DC9A